MAESESSAGPVLGGISSSPARADREAVWRNYLSRIGEGDQDALAAFYDQSSGYVFGIAQRMLESHEDAEEVALDVYKQIWRGPRGYDSTRGSVAAWLMTMTRSRALDRLRSKAARGRVEQPWDPDRGLEPSAGGFEEQSLLALDRRRILAALGNLPAEQRRVIEMAFFRGLSHGELAEQLGLPLGTVKTRIRQGMMKLRQSLSEAR